MTPDEGGAAGPDSDRPVGGRPSGPALPAGRGAFAASIAWGALLLWGAAVWVVSSLEDPSSDLGVPWAVPDKWTHLVEYAIGGFLAREALLPVRRLSPGSAAVLLCAVWAVVDEIHQGFVPGRSTEALDALADVAGAALGAALHACVAPMGVVRPSR